MGGSPREPLLAGLRFHAGLLGGSWVVISGVTSRLILVITKVTLLIII